MTRDPIVEEVRAARRNVEDQAHMAGMKLGDYLRNRQERSDQRFVL
jgi:hypothetical protein